MLACKHRAIKRRLDLPEIKSYAPGIYARSETLVQATRDLDRGRTTEAAVQDQREVDLRSFLDAQREAGLDYLSDGLLNWQDIFRPFDEAARGLEEPPELVRDRILYAARVLGPERIEVNTDCGLRTRTWEVSLGKLKNMVEGTRLAEEALNGS